MSHHRADQPAARRARSSGFFDWGLNLPEIAVSRRIIRNLDIEGRVILGDLRGPGCIRRFQVTGRNIGRELILRITFDGHSVPHVEAPLADFFGIMHNLSEMSGSAYRKEHCERASYRLNTPFLISNPHNAFTAYFPMPFADSARFEVINDSGEPVHLFYYIDWHEYNDQVWDEPLRFCARWRREAPVPDYQDDFFMLDADGPGRLIGYVHSIDMLYNRHIMRWSHAGSDNIYIDGMGRYPAYLRGHGAEDTFGASYGGHTYSPQSSLFSDLPYYVQKDEGDQDCLRHTDRQKLVGYRFFAHEAVYFDDAIHLRFGSRAHDVAATVYWYSARPVRPYVQMPPYPERLPGIRPGRRYDIGLPDSGQWWTCGPFPLPFTGPLPTADDFDANQPMEGRIWRHYAAKRGFVDLNHIFRPAPSNANTATLTAAAVARCEFEAPQACKATITLGWDDELVLRLNDGEAQLLGNHPYFCSRDIEVSLREGVNHLAIMLTNTPALSRGAWAFSCCIVTEQGDVLLPSICYVAPDADDGTLLKVDLGAGDSNPQNGFLAFVPPYAQDANAFTLGKAIDIICSPQSERLTTPLGPITVTLAASDNTSIGFREHEPVTAGPHTAFSELIRSEVRANHHEGGKPVELTLTLEGLPSGTYHLETWHHVHSAECAPTDLKVRGHSPTTRHEICRQTVGLNPDVMCRMTHVLEIDGGESLWVAFSAENAPAVLNGFVLAQGLA